MDEVQGLDPSERTHSEASESAAKKPKVDPEPELKEKDIELVMCQTGAHRDDVVAALRANDYDLVQAIMSLSEPKLELIVSQTGASRDQAVASLRANEFDLVEAVLKVLDDHEELFGGDRA